MKRHEAESEQGYNGQFPFVPLAPIFLILVRKFVKAALIPPVEHRPITLENFQIKIIKPKKPYKSSKGKAITMIDEFLGLNDVVC